MGQLPNGEYKIPDAEDAEVSQKTQKIQFYFLLTSDATAIKGTGL
jgi:hypothetical protein